MKFSANLGFLWADLSLPDAIWAAKRAGFAAVECHWPYDTPSAYISRALQETGLPMLGINTSRGDLERGENGLSALPGRKNEAQQAIKQAVEYAVAVGSKNVHVMSGYAEGDQARDTFLENLRFAAKLVRPTGVGILIEPLNHRDAPGYFLQTTEQAKHILEELSEDNVRLMFDCYHVQIMEGDIVNRLHSLLPIVGHIQFASVPERSEPGDGELNYRYIFKQLKALGYTQPIGAEYRPKSGQTDGNLDWMKLWSED